MIDVPGGLQIMIFSGGEPFAPDIYELVAHAASRVAPGVRQQRHAHHRRGGLPPEGGRRDRHGHLRVAWTPPSTTSSRPSNAHALTMAGIGPASAGLPFQLHTTVVDWNRDEVCAISTSRGDQRCPTSSSDPRRPRRVHSGDEPGVLNEALLREIMKSAEVSIDVNPPARRSSPAWRSSSALTASPAAAWRGSPAASWGGGIVRPAPHDRRPATMRTPSTRFGRRARCSSACAPRPIPAPAGCDYKDGCGGCRPAPPTTTTATSWPR
ncbi:MAG: hypothetical protein ACLUW6_09465 [Coriobacteriaceae bacterium]